MMKFKIGDKVKLIDDNLAGIVVGFRNNGDVSVEIDEMVFYISPTNLIVGGDFDKDIFVTDATIVAKESGNYQKNQPKTIKTNKIENEYEIDLHIQELIDDYRYLNNAEILRIQLSVFKQHLEKAIINNQRKIVFIHGVGEGILKTEIRRIMDQQYVEVSYYDASYQKYGYGATEVIIGR
jgi:hypothetical protein